ncbi:MAG: hypothetical protein ACJAQ6_000502 [Arenicella sp.]|jgi:hypothetical protein
MTGLQIKINQTQAAVKKFGGYIGVSATVPEKDSTISSDAEAIKGVQQKNDGPTSTLSAYEADVTSYLVRVYGPSSCED